MRSLSDHGVAPRLAQALFGLVFYLWKTILPFRLSPLYELPENFNLLDWRFLLIGTILAMSGDLDEAVRRFRQSRMEHKPESLSLRRRYAESFLAMLKTEFVGPGPARQASSKQQP